MRTSTPLPLIISSALLMVLGAQGCTAPTETEDTSHSQSAIIGGRQIGSDESPAAVGWMTDTGAHCSGTVVSATSILTAALCVLDARSVRGAGHRGYRDLPSIVVTNGTLLSTSSAARFHVRRVVAHDSWPDGAEPHDVALIQVDRDLEIPAALLSPGLSEGVSMTEVGYGCDDNMFDRRGGRVRRTGSAYVRSLVGPTFTAEGINGSQICSGDSGGPALLASVAGNGRSVVGAVASWVYWNNQGKVIRSVYARVDTEEMYGWLRAEDPGVALDTYNGGGG